jgi:ApbE superfamily uncharacterized protein (UPF0280 family)
LPLLKRRSGNFTVQVQDVLLTVTAPEDYYEETRAAALSAWEQLQSYGIRNPAFRTSRRPIEMPPDAPPIASEMVASGRAAGVGPLFTIRGAIADHVGRHLARSLSEVRVSAGGDHFVVSRKKMKLPVHHGSDGQPLAVIVDPAKGVRGVATTSGRRDVKAEGVDALAVLARSCMLASAAATAATVMLARPGGLPVAMSYLQKLDGVVGAVVFQGERIGVSGAVEVAR